MRKEILSESSSKDPLPQSGQGLDLDAVARVEITSEDPAHPIEAALGAGQSGGWRAATPGEQKIRLHFDAPQTLKRVHLRFREEQRERTQEFLLRWSGDQGQSYREIVRQQYHFSPPGTAEQSETYTVELAGVTTLELTIIPAMGGGDAVASLARLQVA